MSFDSAARAWVEVFYRDVERDVDHAVGRLDATVHLADAIDRLGAGRL